MSRVLSLTFVLFAALLGCEKSVPREHKPDGGWSPPRVHEDMIGTHNFQLSLGGGHWLLGMRDGRDLNYAIAIPSHVNCGNVPDLTHTSVDGMGAYPALWPRDGTREMFFVDRKISIPKTGQLFALDYDGTVHAIPVDDLDLSPIESQMILRVSYPEPLPPSPICDRIWDKLHAIEQREKQRSSDILQQQREKDAAK